jgi:hypothetical protein
MERNSSNRRVFLTDSEIAKRAAPGGRLAVKGAKNNAYGDAKYTPIGDGSPAAVAGDPERQVRRDKPELAAKRAREGK